MSTQPVPKQAAPVAVPVAAPVVATPAVAAPVVVAPVVAAPAVAAPAVAAPVVVAPAVATPVVVAPAVVAPAVAVPVVVAPAVAAPVVVAPAVAAPVVVAPAVATPGASSTAAAMSGSVRVANARIQPGPQRSARAIRETIIGVAAPANAPDNALKTNSIPTELGIATPDPAPAGRVASPFAAKPNARRAMHQTIIGVAAPANAPNLGAMPLTDPYRLPEPPSEQDKNENKNTSKNEAVGAAETSSKLQAKPPKRAALAPGSRTIIGGLDAAKGSAPTPNGPADLCIAAEAKWNVVIPKQGTVQMTAAEILRACADGKVTGDFNVWQDGLEGWKPIREVEALRTAFRRAGLPLETTAPQHGTAPLAKATAASSASDPPFGAEPPTTRLNLSPDAREQLQDEGVSDGQDDGITRIAASPWQVPDVGAKAAARLASSAGLPPRQNSTPPSRPHEGSDHEHPPLERPSRRPDISPRETVRGQIAAISSNPAPSSITEVISAREPQLLGQNDQFSESDPPATQPLTDPLSLPKGTDAANAEPGTSLELASNAPLDAGSTVAKSASGRTRRHRVWWMALGLFVVIAASTVTSYRTKQPKSMYAYFHRRGWDVPLDRAVKRSTNASYQATQNYIVRPYRALAQRLRKRPGT